VEAPNNSADAPMMLSHKCEQRITAKPRVRYCGNSFGCWPWFLLAILFTQTKPVLKNVSLSHASGQITSPSSSQTRNALKAAPVKRRRFRRVQTVDMVSHCRSKRAQRLAMAAPRPAASRSMEGLRKA